MHNILWCFVAYEGSATFEWEEQGEASVLPLQREGARPPTFSLLTPRTPTKNPRTRLVYTCVEVLLIKLRSLKRRFRLLKNYNSIIELSVRWCLWKVGEWFPGQVLPKT